MMLQKAVFERFYSLRYIFPGYGSIHWRQIYEYMKFIILVEVLKSDMNIAFDVNGSTNINTFWIFSYL